MTLLKGSLTPKGLHKLYSAFPRADLVLQAKESLLSKQYGRLLRTAPQDDLFYQRLRSSSDVKMALMVRASRNLPIKLLAGEYEKILRRRLAVVGGSPDDSALAEMVSKFRWIFPLNCLPSVCNAAPVAHMKIAS